MYLPSHPRSSGQPVDTVIYHCRGCGWAHEPFRIGTCAIANQCPECWHSLSFINYHHETECDLADQVLAEHRARRNGKAVGEV